MKLVASLIVRNELGRYLEPCIEHLLEFCDEIRVLDDSSDDATFDWLTEQQTLMPDRLAIGDAPSFYGHEGKARQHLIDWTLLSEPTHVLTIDADEFVSDGPGLRAALQASAAPAWLLCMEEVWQAENGGLQVRTDGGWHPHRIVGCWKVPRSTSARRALRIPDRQLACGRTPAGVNARAAEPVEISILHFGWARQSEREQRYQRYVDHDGGRFHASQHLQSIMWPDRKVQLQECPWPAGLERWRPAIVAKAAV